MNREHNKELSLLSIERCNIRAQMLLANDKKDYIALASLMEEYKSLNNKYSLLDADFLSLVEENISLNTNMSSPEIKDNISFVSELSERSNSTNGTLNLGLLDSVNGCLINHEKKLALPQTIKSNPNPRNINIPMQKMVKSKAVSNNTTIASAPKLETKLTKKKITKSDKKDSLNKKQPKLTSLPKPKSKSLPKPTPKPKQKSKAKIIANSVLFTTKTDLKDIKVNQPKNQNKNRNSNINTNVAPKKINNNNINHDIDNAVRYRFSAPVYSSSKLYLSAKPKMVDSKYMFYEWSDAKVERVLSRGGIGFNSIRNIVISPFNYVLVTVVQPTRILNKNIRALNKVIHGGHNIVCNIFKPKQKSNDNIFCDANGVKNTLHITGFNITTDKYFYKRFVKIFLSFGNISKVHIATHRASMYPFAIIKFEKLSGAIDCFKTIRWNGLTFDERKLNVSYAKY